MSAAPPGVPRALPAAESTAPPEAARPAGRGASAAPSADRREPTRVFMSLIDHEFARRHLILSAGEEEGHELLLVSERTRPTAVHNVGVRLGRPVRTELMAAEALAAAVDAAYLRAQGSSDPGASPDSEGVPIVVVESSEDPEAELALALREAESDLLSTTGKAPAVRLVDLILFQALLRDASDVHIQPIRGKTLVRYRLDGVLHTVRELPLSLAASVVSRIKVMARLDVAEQRAPQDGRAQVTIGAGGGSGGPAAGANTGPPQAGRRIDLRVSTLPSTYGERVVLRLLDPARSASLLSFSGLGMPEDLRARYTAQAERTSGIVLSTGPTGSGKTTTLYTTLAWVNSAYAGALARGCELNMMTVEDPVEYDLSAAGLAVSQTQVDPKKGVSFAAGLRHILRQDPDVIMVGEIRDEETARIAVQASLTGHLVLSTLHTNDAASAVARLIDLSVEPFLVASSLSAVLAQRLVRTVHRPCAGAGCAACLGTGFKGRTGVFELLVMDETLRSMVERRASAPELKATARRAGMVTLAEAGAALVREGITTREEVSRVIEAQEEAL